MFNLNFNLMFLPLVIFLTIGTNGFSQHKSVVFGKIDKASLEKEIYEKDTSASAVILADYGSTEIEYNTTQKIFYYIFKRHRRIKILKKDGYDWASHNVFLYHDNDDREKIAGIKGYSYNIENGKIVKSKLDKDAIFKENSSENWDEVRFTLPNVKEGTVLEYTYHIISSFLFNFRSWQFQHNIPCVWSEYKISIPEFYNYKKISQGYLAFSNYDKRTVADNISFTTKSRSEGRVVQTSFSTNKIDYVKYVDKWVIKDVPAFIPEKYITTSQDFISRIDFELASVKFPNSTLKPVMNTWQKLNEQLLEYKQFGLQLKKSRFIKDELIAILDNNQTAESKIQAIYDHVKKKVSWNDKNRIYITTSLAEAYEKGSGSSADINLLLVLMLKEAGFNAYPVILSTRNHGRINEHFSPHLSKFNYVIAYVSEGEKEYLLDATDKDLPMQSLPFNCLNGKGRLVSKSDSRWVDLRNGEKYSHRIAADLKFNFDGEIEGEIKKTYLGYDALNVRDKYKKLGKKEFVENLIKDKEDLAITNITVTNAITLNDNVNIKYKVSPEGYFMNAGNLIYIDPMLDEKTKENPFKLEKREYPVDFGCPIDEIYMFNMEIPEGYSIEEAPKTSMVALPNNGGVFKYSVSTINNKVRILSVIKIKQMVFLPNEYGAIKKFFDVIIAKQSEKLILKHN